MLDVQENHSELQVATLKAVCGSVPTAQLCSWTDNCWATDLNPKLPGEALEEHVYLGSTFLRLAGEFWVEGALALLHKHGSCPLWICSCSLVAS